VGQVDRCVLCRAVRSLLTALRRLPRDSDVFIHCADVVDSLARLAVQVPRDSDVFNHCVGVIDSLTRLAVQDGEEGPAHAEPGDAEPTQDRQTSTSGWIDYGTQWRR
jgi:hypothetical protein